MNVPLLPLPPAPTRMEDLLGSDQMVPVIAHRDPGTREFAITTSDALDATLIAYDAQGKVVGTGDDKLHNA